MKPSTKDVRRTSFGFLIKTLSARLDAQMEIELKRHGLNLKQFGTLMMVFEMEGASQIEIGKNVGIPGYATTRTLDELEKKGLVYRHRPPENRRTHHIYLTDEGKKLRKVLPPIIQKVNDEALAALNAEDQNKLISILTKLTFGG